MSYKAHLTNTAAKVRTRNNIIRKLCGTTWGATAETLRTSALGLVYSAAEYGAPIWLNSRHVHKLDTELNNTMRTISGCIKSTPTYWLPTLSCIAPPHLRRQDALLREYNKLSANELHPIHEDVTAASLSRLKSRRPVIKTARELQEDNFGVIHKWTEIWSESTPPNIHLNLPVNCKPKGFEASRQIWKTANRIRTGHGRCADLLHKWGKLATPHCDCGCACQTVAHIVTECENRSYPGDKNDFFTLPLTATQWIEDLDIAL